MMVVITDQWRSEIGSFNYYSLCLSKCKWDNNHMFLKILFVYFLLMCLIFRVGCKSNVSLESYFYFVFIVSLFPLPSKHSSWWRRLEDVLKTSFVFVFRRRLDQGEYVRLSLMSSEDVFKTSSRRLGQD